MKERMEITNCELAKDTNSRFLALSKEGTPVFPERVAEIVERSLKEKKPVFFTSIMCRVSKLSGHAERRFSTPDILWSKERNDQPVEITSANAKKEGLSLVNPTLGLVFSEIPRVIKTASGLGIPWRFSLIVGDDPPKDVRNSLAKLFNEKAAKAFELMSWLHLESIKRVFSFGLENVDLDPNDKRIRVTSFSQTTNISTPGLEKAGDFLDAMATLARKLTLGEVSNLPKEILREKEAAIDLFREIEPKGTRSEIEKKVLTEFIPEKALAGVLINNLAVKANSAGAIILSAIPPEPLLETQSVFLPRNDRIPVLFPIKNVHGEAKLGEISPHGTLVPEGSSWFSVATALTWDLLRWLNSEVTKMNPEERKIAERFLPVILGSKEKRPYR